MADPVFFPVSRVFTLGEIAALTQSDLLRGEPTAEIHLVAPLDKAAEGHITFLDNPRYLPVLADTKATACLCQAQYAERVPQGVAVLANREPYRAVAMVMAALFPTAMRAEGVYGGEVGAIAPGAHVHPQAKLESGVTVEPGAVIGKCAEIGRGTVVAANAVIGENVRIGRDCYIGPNASIIVALIGNRVIIHGGVRIGQDGFGFAMGPRGHLKVPQIGRVVIQDDVEIGANTTIDRGANRDTIIGEGTKIDNGVQIGHNVETGRHCVIVAQVGISGSSKLGDFVVIAGQAGIAGHVTIGSGAQVAGASSVKDDVPPRQKVMGYPAQDLKDFMRERMILDQLVKDKKAPKTP